MQSPKCNPLKGDAFAKEYPANLPQKCVDMTFTVFLNESFVQCEQNFAFLPLFFH